MAKAPKLTFHKGIDYACIMTPRQTTDAPLAMLYGIDRDVTRYGNLFAAAPVLRAALEAIQARVRGEYDNAALVAFGPLSGSVADDCAIIAEAALAAAAGKG